ncbi:hypothetical protein QTN24_16980 [Cupriavidus sp. SZY C1]|uniref:hypothetical protein n=1 Tax=Cupriavidus sp. SZY C1 TaxID=3055037 RepID=UPI0028B4D4AB|nr:hypothetical protein [Cupriavidus sp. SZY C1]MDT6963194.1 hypothetical protein [Cupriavidus sp. SZY C1]
MYFGVVTTVSPLATTELPSNAASSSPVAQDRPEATRPDENSFATKSDGTPKSASDRITMSHGGRVLSKTEDKDATTRAIEDSKYPDAIKKLMIKIRDLQQQLRDKAAELQEAASDQKLPARQREMKVDAIRSAVGTLSSAIQAATATLNDTMTAMRLSSDDRKQIATMISAI